MKARDCCYHSFVSQKKNIHFSPCPAINDLTALYLLLLGYIFDIQAFKGKEETKNTTTGTVSQIHINWAYSCLHRVSFDMSKKMINIYPHHIKIHQPGYFLIKILLRALQRLFGKGNPFVICSMAFLAPRPGLPTTVN